MPRWPGRSSSVRGRGWAGGGMNRKLLQGALSRRGAPAVTQDLLWEHRESRGRGPGKHQCWSAAADRRGRAERLATHSTSVMCHTTQQPNRFCQRNQRTSIYQKEGALKRGTRSLRSWVAIPPRPRLTVADVVTERVSVTESTVAESNGVEKIPKQRGHVAA